MDATEFWTICSANGLLLDREQMDAFERYANELVYWNQKVNLISRRDIEHVWLKHILHSVSLFFTGEMPSFGRVLDIGTGGGLPGIPIKIVNKKLEVVLLDSVAKKVNTVAMLASHVTPHGLTAIRDRAEELPKHKKFGKPYDLVVSRATAPLVDLMKWSQPLLKPDGKILTLKGGDLTNEISHATGKFPDAKITVIDLHVAGTDWFEQEEKKVVRCNY